MREFLGMSYRLEHFPIPDFPRLTHFGHAGDFCVDQARGGDWLHGHFGFELKYITQGRFSFSLRPDLAPVTLAPGDLLVTAPDFAHRFDTGGKPVGYFWFGLQTGRRIARSKRSDFRVRQPRDPLEVTYEEQADADLETLGGSLKIAGFLVLHRFWEAEALLSGMEAEIDEKRKYARQLVYLKILEIFTRIQRRLEEHALQEKPGARLKDAEKYLKDHLERSPRLAELARVAGMSPAHFSRRFHQRYGSSPVAYANQLRLERAKRLLLESQPVSKAARDCGFKDPFYFSAFFKSKTGIAPSLFRKREGMPG